MMWRAIFKSFLGWSALGLVGFALYKLFGSLFIIFAAVGLVFLLVEKRKGQ